MENINVSINKKAFIDNLNYVKHIAPNSLCCLVVKGDAYGHGLHALIDDIIEENVDYLGVCDNAEINIIKSHGFQGRIFRMRTALQQEYEHTLINNYDIEENVSTFNNALLLSRLAYKYDTVIKIHLNIDIGIGRTGLDPEDIETIFNIIDLPYLDIVGVMGHFPVACNSSPDVIYNQACILFKCYAKFKGKLKHGPLLHIANSTITLRFPDLHLDMVRLGSICYGYNIKNLTTLKPILNVSSQITDIRAIQSGKSIGYNSTFTTIRPSYIAEIPVGISNGLFRELSNKGFVLIEDQYCPIVGMISLNMMNVDITDILIGDRKIKLEDFDKTVVIIGTFNDNTISVSDIASIVETIETQIVMNITRYNRIIVYNDENEIPLTPSNIIKSTLALFENI